MMTRKIIMTILVAVCTLSMAQGMTAGSAAADQDKMDRFIDDLMGKMTLQEHPETYF